ncbi:MAG: carotenoid oxygenase family protein [Microcoleus sp.]
MNVNTTKTTEDIKKSFPRSILSVSREEFGLPEDNQNAKPPLKLIVEDGKILPEGLHGHIFIISAAGSVDSQSLFEDNIVFPSSDGSTPFYNGDGIVYRIDLDNLEQGISLTTRLLKTPCYYADLATTKCLPDLKFQNFGIMRMSKKLGIRNQLNTGFLPMKYSEEEGERLLVTWDMGRPYEIDTKTLEIVTPVGCNKEWRAMNYLLSRLPFQPNFCFKLVHSSAHPCFDPKSRQMFTVNCGWSVLTFVAQSMQSIINAIKNMYGSTKILKNINITGYNYLMKIVIKKIKIFNHYVDLIVWDGKGKLDRWNVIYNGNPLQIKQSIHQMGLTEDYVLLVDTGFKFLLEELLPSTTNKMSKYLKKLLRNLINYPQLSDTDIYLIKRTDLKPGQKNIEAKKVVIPRETTHFLVDFKNPNKQITLHLAHICAWDTAEWIRDIDFDDTEEKPLSNKLPPMYGMTVGPLDISRMGCYVIDAENAKVVRSDLTSVYQDNSPSQQAEKKEFCQYTWGPALYAYQDNQPTEKFQDIYWSFFGAWEDILTEHGLKMYAPYKYREVPVPELLELTKKGIKSNLLRLHIKPLESVKDGENRLEIQDIYQFETGYFVNSPQFIPSKTGVDGSSTNGYIMCVVYHGTDDQPDNGNQIWIFDATNLKQGPLCKLWHPQLNFGITVHTTWLPKIAKRTATYNIPVEQDYQDLVAQQPAEIQELFEKEIYPHFKSKNP